MSYSADTNYKLFGNIEEIFGTKNSNSTSTSEKFDINKYLEIGNALSGLNGSNTNTQNTKASLLQTGLKTILSLISSLQANEANKAKQEIKNQETASNKLKDEEFKLSEKLKEEINNISKQIKLQTETLQKAIKSIEENNEKLEETKEKVQKIVEEIEKQQEALKKATTVEEQISILGTLQNLSGQITGILANVQTIQKEIASSSKDVENATVNIEEARGNSVSIAENGEMKIASLVEKSSKLMTEEAATQVKGQVNITTGIAAEKAAQASSTNLFTGSQAPKLYRIANDQKLAGNERTTGSLTNLKTIMQGLGGLKNNTELLTNFKNSVGDALSGFDTMVGDWNTTITPVIESLGSYQTIQKTNKMLEETIAKDLENLGKNNKDQKDNKNRKTTHLATSDLDLSNLKVFEKVKKS